MTSAAVRWMGAQGLFMAAIISVAQTQCAAQTLPEPAGPHLADPAADDNSAPEKPYRSDEKPVPDMHVHLGLTFEPRVGRAAVVRSVAPGGPAHHAGLQPGDTIEAINGNRVRSPHDVPEMVDALRPGDVIDIDFSRRISGQTQAVLEGVPQEHSVLAEDFNRTYELPDRHRPQQSGQVSYEPLPSPPYSQARARQASDVGARPRESGDDQRTRTDEPPRPRRLFERGRERDSRPLLPWRRN
jgi:membrane-associated protease RseP (regulator of RpoE activity)